MMYYELPTFKCFTCESVLQVSPVLITKEKRTYTIRHYPSSECKDRGDIDYWSPTGIGDTSLNNADPFWDLGCCGL